MSGTENQADEPNANPNVGKNPKQGPAPAGPAARKNPNAGRGQGPRGAGRPAAKGPAAKGAGAKGTAPKGPNAKGPAAKGPGAKGPAAKGQGPKKPGAKAPGKGPGAAKRPGAAKGPGAPKGPAAKKPAGRKPAQKPKAQSKPQPKPEQKAPAKAKPRPTSPEKRAAQRRAAYDTTIVVEDVRMTYTVNALRETPEGRKPSALTRFGNMVRPRPRVTVEALKGVSLVAREEEFIGVVGSNGSGKSTLMRLIAGVETPDSGTVLARKQPALLGVNAALQPGLSGAENVRLGLLAMGFSPAQAAVMFQDVVEMSALGKDIYRPMGGYSSGMGARLRFAISVAARPSILLIDEALATGDATFEDKSKAATDDLLANAGTVMMVNHSAQAIQKMCTRVIWLHKGETVMDGEADYVAEKYRWWSWNLTQGKPDVAEKLLREAMEEGEEQNVHVMTTSPLSEFSPRHSRPAGARREKVEVTEPPTYTAAQDVVWAADFRDPDNLRDEAQFPVRLTPTDGQPIRASRGILIGGDESPDLDGPPVAPRAPEAPRPPVFPQPAPVAPPQQYRPEPQQSPSVPRPVIKPAEPDIPVSLGHDLVDGANVRKTWPLAPEENEETR
ncbi:ABC transporter ATP-binding protein [Brevibacterium litoralis]|uniref:ABC transporter ATP-binding protein n=1 Tax=Brevibacterium litoralis TaxID=3138935 RepID=UPI0032EE4A9E